MPVMLKAFSYTSLQVKIKFYKNSKPSNEKILLSKGRRLRNFEQFSNQLHIDIDFIWKIHKQYDPAWHYKTLRYQIGSEVERQLVINLKGAKEKPSLHPFMHLHLPHISLPLLIHVYVTYDPSLNYLFLHNATPCTQVQCHRE